MIEGFKEFFEIFFSILYKEKLYFAKLFASDKHFQKHRNFAWFVNEKLKASIFKKIDLNQKGSKYRDPIGS